MRALSPISRFLRRCRNTVLFVHRLGYPWRDAWQKAGWWLQ